MAGINGKWQLASSDGLLPYYKSCGLSNPEIEAKVSKLETAGAGGPTEVISLDGNTMKLSILRPDGVAIMENTCTLGQEAGGKGLDGRDIKVTITQDGNSFTRKEAGAGYNATWTRTVSGDDMTVVMDSGSAKCTRKYKRC